MTLNIMSAVTKQDIFAGLLASLTSGPVFSWLVNIFDPPPPAMADSLPAIIFVHPFLMQVITYPVTLLGVFVIGIPLHGFVRKVFGDHYMLIGLSGGPIVFGIVVSLCRCHVAEIHTSFWIIIACSASVSGVYAVLSRKFNQSLQPTTDSSG